VVVIEEKLACSRFWLSHAGLRHRVKEEGVALCAKPANRASFDFTNDVPSQVLLEPPVFDGKDFCRSDRAGTLCT
jgi:hypothetical protein